jgi:hypothetical protein
VDIEILEKLRALGKKTRIPLSRLSDEAFEDLLKKYDKRKDNYFD